MPLWGAVGRCSVGVAGPRPAGTPGLSPPGPPGWAPTCTWRWPGAPGRATRGSGLAGAGRWHPCCRPTAPRGRPTRSTRPRGCRRSPRCRPLRASGGCGAPGLLRLRPPCWPPCAPPATQTPSPKLNHSSIIVGFATPKDG
eukprot:scaffold128253_cov37-Prasinocladus_malaysianus.AAC.2